MDEASAKTFQALTKEKFVLQKIIFALNNSLRLDKRLHYMKQVLSCLRFIDTHKSKNYAEWDKKSVAVVYEKMSKCRSICEKAVAFLRLQMRIGHLVGKTTMIVALLSRIWCLTYFLESQLSAENRIFDKPSKKIQNKENCQEHRTSEKKSGVSTKAISRKKNYDFYSDNSMSSDDDGDSMWTSGKQKRQPELRPTYIPSYAGGNNARGIRNRDVASVQNQYKRPREMSTNKETDQWKKMRLQEPWSSKSVNRPGALSMISGKAKERTIEGSSDELSGSSSSEEHSEESDSDSESSMDEAIGKILKSVCKESERGGANEMSESESCESEDEFHSDSELDEDAGKKTLGLSKERPKGGVERSESDSLDSEDDESEFDDVGNGTLGLMKEQSEDVVEITDSENSELSEDEDADSEPKGSEKESKGLAKNRSEGAPTSRIPVISKNNSEGSHKISAGRFEDNIVDVSESESSVIEVSDSEKSKTKSENDSDSGHDSQKISGKISLQKCSGKLKENFQCLSSVGSKDVGPPSAIPVEDTSESEKSSVEDDSETEKSLSEAGDSDSEQDVSEESKLKDSLSELKSNNGYLRETMSKDDVDCGSERTKDTTVTIGSAFGVPKVSAFGDPKIPAFGDLKSSAFGDPKTSAFGDPETSAFGDPETSAFDYPKTSAFGDPEASAFEASGDGHFDSECDGSKDTNKVSFNEDINKNEDTKVKKSENSAAKPGTVRCNIDESEAVDSNSEQCLGNKPQEETLSHVERKKQDPKKIKLEDSDSDDSVGETSESEEELKSHSILERNLCNESNVGTWNKLQDKELQERSLRGIVQEVEESTNESSGSDESDSEADDINQEQNFSQKSKEGILEQWKNRTERTSNTFSASEVTNFTLPTREAVHSSNAIDSDRQSEDDALGIASSDSESSKRWESISRSSQKSNGDNSFPQREPVVASQKSLASDMIQDRKFDSITNRPNFKEQPNKIPTSRSLECIAKEYISPPKTGGTSSQSKPDRRVPLSLKTGASGSPSKQARRVPLSLKTGDSDSQSKSDYSAPSRLTGSKPKSDCSDLPLATEDISRKGLNAAPSVPNERTMKLTNKTKRFELNEAVESPSLDSIPQSKGVSVSSSCFDSTVSVNLREKSSWKKECINLTASKKAKQSKGSCRKSKRDKLMKLEYLKNVPIKRRMSVFYRSRFS